MGACGQLSYGTFKFPETFNHSVSSRPWYGADEVSSKGIECLLTVEFLLYEGMEEVNIPFTEYLEAVRKQLLTPRLNLVIRGTGWAFSGQSNQPDVILGSSGGPSIIPVKVVADLNNGPLPQSLDIDPIGGINAVKCTWRCTFWYNQCGSTSANSIIEYNYSTSFSVDRNGRTKLAITGTYGFAGGNLAANTKTLAPRNQLFIQPIIPVGFELIDQSHSINETGTRVNFKFDIQEINADNAYFPFISSIDGRHQATSFATGTDPFKGVGFSTWGSKLDVSINLLPKIHPRYAYEIFLWILMQRTVFYGVPKLGGTVPDGRKSYPVPANNPMMDQERPFTELPFTTGRVFVKRLTITEGIFSNSHTFSAEWTIACSLDALIQGTGLFTRVTSTRDNDNFPWESIIPNPNKLYSDLQQRRELNQDHFAETSGTSANRTSHLYFVENNNVLGKLLFDPCTTPSIPVPGQEYSFLPLPGKRLPTNLFPFLPTAINALLPDPERSWLKYEIDFTIEEDSNVQQIPINSGDSLNQTQLLSRKTTDPTDFNLSDRSSISANFVPFSSGSGLTLSQPNTPGTTTGAVIVASGESTYTLTMNGSATRVGYPISCPAVYGLEGNILYRQDGAKFTQRRVNSGTVPIYSAEWTVSYVMEGKVSSPHLQLFAGGVSTNALPERFV
jgi:hypothetical protein